MNHCKHRQFAGRGFFVSLAVVLAVHLCVLLRPPSAAAGANPFGCVGDCDQTRHVSIDEILVCVRGALLGRDVFPRCFEVCDVDGDGMIRIHEIVQAVEYAIDGCRPER